MVTMLRYSLIRAVSVLVPAAGLMTAARAQDEAATDKYFEEKVRPVLESSCTHCHNDKEQEGDLRLDSLEACLKGGENGTALVPGDPSKSKLYTLACLDAKDDDVMPPTKDGPPLTKVQTDVLGAWIKAGAKWPAGVVLGVQPRMQFERDVQPILEMYCVSCHRADNPDGGAKGDLDMTTYEACVDSDLTPFYPNKSPIYKTTAVAEDHDDLMPPKKSGGPLKKEQIEKLRLWVLQGAPWPAGLKIKQRMKVEERPPSPDKCHKLTEKRSVKAD